MKSIPLCLQKGNGGLRHYKYWSNSNWTGRTMLKSKKAILEAINLKLIILRRDKITNKLEVFNYKTSNFKEVIK